MTTPPIELAATVESIERKVPEPEGCWLLSWSHFSQRWGTDHVRPKRREEVLAMMRDYTPGIPLRILTITPAPSPTETGAVPVDAITQLLAIASNEGQYSNEGFMAEVRAWLASVTR